MFSIKGTLRAAVVLGLPVGLWAGGGCDKQETKAPAPQPAPATRPATRPTAGMPMPEAPSAGTNGTFGDPVRASETQPATPTLPGGIALPGAADLPAIPGAPPATQPAAPTPGTPTPGTGTETPAPAAGDKTAEAQTLLDQAMKYIKENKVDLAEKSLTQLDGMKSSLPAEWGPRIDGVRKALAAAKAGGGVKLPEGVPGIPK